MSSKSRKTHSASSPDSLSSAIPLSDQSAVQTLLRIIMQTNNALEALEDSDNLAQAIQSIRDARASAEEGLSQILQSLIQTQGDEA